MTIKPTYEELETRIRELESITESKPENHDRDVIRTLSKSFQQLADRSQDAIYLFDIESGTFPFFNKRFLELYEVKQEGRTILSSYSAAQHIHPKDAEKLRAARERTLKSGGTKGEVEYRYINLDGTSRWMHDRWSVVRDRQNKAIAIEGFIRDNTQKKQAEDELTHSRNSALIGSYILQNRKFKYVNPEFCRIDQNHLNPFGRKGFFRYGPGVANSLRACAVHAYPGFYTWGFHVKAHGICRCGIVLDPYHSRFKVGHKFILTDQHNHLFGAKGKSPDPVPNHVKVDQLASLGHRIGAGKIKISRHGGPDPFRFFFFRDAFFFGVDNFRAFKGSQG